MGSFILHLQLDMALFENNGNSWNEELGFYQIYFWFWVLGILTDYWSTETFLYNYAKAYWITGPTKTCYIIIYKMHCAKIHSADLKILFLQLLVTWKSTSPVAKPTYPAFLWLTNKGEMRCCLHLVFSGYFMLFWYLGPSSSYESYISVINDITVVKIILYVDFSQQLQHLWSSN